MKGINYWAFLPDGQGKSLDARTVLEKAKSLGFDSFEFTMDPGSAVHPDTTEKEASAIKDMAADLGMALPTMASGMAWGASPTHPDPKVRSKALGDYRRALEIASGLGCKTLLYLPGMVSACFVPDYAPQPYLEVMKRAKEAVQTLLPHAEAAGVKLGVENVWNRFLLSPVEMRDFIDSFDSPWVGSYFDVGNVMLYGHPEDWIRTLGKRILAVHLKDFRVSVGNLDGFVDLLAGDVPYPEVMKAFGEIGYRGPYTVEYVPAAPGVPEKAAAAVDLILNMK